MNNLILLAVVSLCTFCSCNKEESVVAPPPPNPTIYYSFSCGIEELHWLPDNLHIIMSDQCGIFFRKINILSGNVEIISVMENHKYEVLHLYVSNEITESFFYSALDHTQGDRPQRLFSYNFITKATTLVKDELPEHGEYRLADHRFVISGSPIEIVDLRTGESEFINANGFVRAVSPNGEMMVVRNASNSVMYDFTCDCIMPSPGQLNMQSLIWNNAGLFGYATTPFDVLTQSINLQITNFTTGFQLTSIDHFAGGPWSAYHGTQLLVFKFDPDKTKSERMLVAYDCINQTTRNILISEGDTHNRDIDINQVSISPDQTKLAYTQGWFGIKVASLD